MSDDRADVTSGNGYSRYDQPETEPDDTPQNYGEALDHALVSRVARYTNNSPVVEGDSIRYKQAPGGLMTPNPDWTYGVAAKFPRSYDEVQRMISYNEKQGYVALDPEELYLFDGTSYYMIYSHVVERT